MLILIVDGGRRTRRRDERARAREGEEISIRIHYRARKICGFIRNNCCGKRNYAGICSEIVVSISVIVYKCLLTWLIMSSKFLEKSVEN